MTFLDATRHLLKERAADGLLLSGWAPQSLPPIAAAMGEAFGNKTEKRCGNPRMPWAQWLVEGVFPQTLYREHGESLDSMMRDERLWSPARYAATDAWNSFFGRLAQPRPHFPRGFLGYAVERLRGPYRGQPQFYFSVESPEWVWAELAKHPERPRSWHSSAACVMNVAFRVRGDELLTHLIVKHMQWSHSLGDWAGAHAICAAVAKEVGLTPRGVAVYAVSATMDAPKQARKFMELVADRNDQAQPADSAAASR